MRNRGRKNYLLCYGSKANVEARLSESWVSILSFAECVVTRCAGGARFRGELFDKKPNFEHLKLKSDFQKTVGPDFFVTLRSFIVRCHLSNCGSAVRSRFVYFVKRTRIR